MDGLEIIILFTMVLELLVHMVSVAVAVGVSIVGIVLPIGDGDIVAADVGADTDAEDNGLSSSSGNGAV